MLPEGHSFDPRDLDGWYRRQKLGRVSADVGDSISRDRTPVLKIGASNLNGVASQRAKPFKDEAIENDD